jgi:acetyl esterase
MTDLHPQAQQLFAAFASSDAKPFSASTPQEARAAAEALTALSGRGPQMADVTDRRIAVDGGEIDARVYRPTLDPVATIVWFHGGGWVVGGLETADTVCRTLAQATGARVVSVDYRHAPEHRFPTAANDAIAALRWVADEIADAGKLIVAGESSGGNLAAVAAQAARAAAGPEVALQLLFYPVTDCDFDRPSYVEHAEAAPIGRADMEWFWDHYVPHTGDRPHPQASPLRADLRGLPRAVVVVAGHDPLHDEGVAYAEALRGAGGDVTLHRYEDMPHGFLSFLNVFDRADEAVREAAAAVQATVRTEER